MFSFSN